MGPLQRSFPKLYLIGDSNTQQSFKSTGFGVKLQEDYIRKCDVINRGFSGYTSRDLCLMLTNLLKEDNNNKKIKIATILLGSNDAVSADIDSRSSTIAQYKKCIENIIEQLKQEDISHIILISPPPVDVEHWRNVCFDSFGSCGGFHEDSENTKEFAQACRDIASGHPDVLFFDLYTCVLNSKDWKEMFYDGLHFSETGSQFVYTRLKEILDPIVDTLSMVYPDWKEIDQNNRELSLL